MIDASVHYVVDNQQPHPPHSCVGPGVLITTYWSTHTRPENRFPPTPHTRWGTGVDRFSVVIAWGKRPVPSRTRKLRPTALMVLHSEGCGRVRHRRNSLQLRGCTPTGEHPLNTFNTHGQPWTAAPANARVAVHGFLLLTLVHHDPRSSPSPPGQWGDPHPALLPSLPSPCPGLE